MAMLPPPPTKQIALPWQRGFSGGGKKEEYAKPHLGRGVSYGKIGLTTVAVTHDLLSGMQLVLLRKELIRLWNSILPEPGQPSAKLSKLICLTACKKTKHTVSRWYRTIYITCLVASYDTHKGKRWLNPDPPKPQGGDKNIILKKIGAIIQKSTKTWYMRYSWTGCTSSHYYIMKTVGPVVFSKIKN